MAEITLPEAVTVVRDVVAEVCAKTNFNDDQCPVGDLGLASIDGVQVAVCLESRLGIKIDNRLNPLFDDDRRTPRTITETASWLVSQVRDSKDSTGG